MVLFAAELIGILMRWAHIASVAVLTGGMLYARMIAMPALAKAPAAERGPVLEWLTARYRPLVYSAIAGVVVSGLYNFLTHRGHTSHYHMWFGIKMLLALHVFAASLLAVRLGPATPEEESKRARRMTGVVVSAMIIILISAYLRRIY
jgi:uncharacterized membrane protein